jgi:uncharacterized lipoprotein YmbA
MLFTMQWTFRCLSVVFMALVIAAIANSHKQTHEYQLDVQNLLYESIHADIAIAWCVYEVVFSSRAIVRLSVIALVSV